MTGEKNRVFDALAQVALTILTSPLISRPYSANDKRKMQAPDAVEDRKLGGRPLNSFFLPRPKISTGGSAR